MDKPLSRDLPSDGFVPSPPAPSRTVPVPPPAYGASVAPTRTVPARGRTVPESTYRYDLDEQVRRYVRDALNAVRLGEEYWYSVTSTVVPSPGNAGTPGFVVTMYARNPGKIGEYLVNGVVQVGFPTEDEFKNIVGYLVSNLREQAHEALR